MSGLGISGLTSSTVLCAQKRLSHLSKTSHALVCPISCGHVMFKVHLALYMVPALQDLLKPYQGKARVNSSPPPPSPRNFTQNGGNSGKLREFSGVVFNSVQTEKARLGKAHFSGHFLGGFDFLGARLLSRNSSTGPSKFHNCQNHRFYKCPL